MALIKCPDCGKDVSDAAPSCANCGRPIATQQPPKGAASKKKNSPLALGCLVVLLIFLGLWVISAIFTGGSARRPVPSPEKTESTFSLDPQLELIGFNWHIEYGYAVLEGQVRNLSPKPIANVAAVGSFYDTNGGFITSADALIDYNPILPGQTSPFRVMHTQNPAMKKAGVEFKHLMGGTISFRNAESKAKAKK